MGLAAVSAALALPASASAAVATVSFAPEADTYVSASNPDTSFGTSTSFQVDGKPTKVAYLRFDVDGLDGRAVVGARLRLYATNASDLGGRVFTASSTGWNESMTWNTRPAVDGPLLGSFGAVATERYYEADLSPAAFADGEMTLAMDTLSTDDARYRSREIVSAKGASGRVPRLIIEVESGARVDDGLSEIALPRVGSSEPTYYGTQRRLAVTESGRLLTVHGHHATGPQLAWRDPAGNWQTQTTGAAPDGILKGGTGTGDWPASIAVARDSLGVEHAWVVYARASPSKVDPVFLQRLSDLDSPLGPTLGARVAINSPPLGAYKPDLAFEPAPGGGMRGVLVWSRKASDSLHETVVGWLTDLDTDTPTIHHRVVLDATRSGSRWGTVVPAAGMNVVMRTGGKLVLFRHAPGGMPASWTGGPKGLAAHGYPSAVGLDSGEILNVVESDQTAHVVKVQRYSADGTAQPVELTLNGYSRPTIASDGVNAWIVMVREDDGYVASRSFTPATGWASTDRIEIGPEGGGDHNFPNLVRETDGRLRFVVEGPNFDKVRSSVLAFQRGL